MIENTSTFQYQLYECFRGQPSNKDTRITIPYLTKAGRKIKHTRYQYINVPQNEENTSIPNMIHK